MGPGSRPGRREYLHRTHLRLLAAPSARGLMKSLPSSEIRGRRERPDARCTRGLVCNVHKKVRTRAYRSSGEHPAFPAQWLYGLYRGRPGETGSIATTADGILPANLTPAFGRRTTRLRRPLTSRSSFVTSAATASHHNVRDDGRRPSGG